MGEGHPYFVNEVVVQFLAGHELTSLDNMHYIRETANIDGGITHELHKD